VETAELRAIRESILRVRMSDWLQLPNEAPWLHLTLKAFINVLRGLWQNDANIDDVITRSNWLLEQVDLRGWAHRFAPENADNIIRTGRGGHMLLLLTPLVEVKPAIVNAYWAWAEESILAPVKEQFPELYEWLVKWQREQVYRLAETDVSQEVDS